MGNAPGLQALAARTLKHLAEFGKGNCCQKLASVEGAIRALVGASNGSNDSSIKQPAVYALAAMASLGGQDLCMKICETPGSISNLVDAMGKKDVPGLPLCGTYALHIIAKYGKGDGCQEISGVTGALEALVDAIAVGENPVRCFAARTLSSLACGGGQVLCAALCQIPNSVSNLVDAMGEKDVNGLPLLAACALKDLAECGKRDCCQTISDVTGALQALVDATAVGEDDEVRAVAAYMLSILASDGGQVLCTTVCNITNSVSNLVDAMGKKDLRGLPLCAAHALKNLAEHGKGNCCQEISGVTGVLQALVNAIAVGEDDPVRCMAAHTLSSLALNGGQVVCTTICKIPNSVSNFAAAMGQPDGCLRLCATYALNNLVEYGEEECHREISRVRGVLQALVNAAADSSHPAARIPAMLTLSNLARHDQDLCMEICNTAESISILVDAMGKEDNDELAMVATVTLTAWAEHCEGECCRRISRDAGAIQVDAFARSEDENVQKAAAHALAAMAFHGDQDLRKEICKTPGAIPNLVHASDKADSSTVRDVAIFVLKNIAEMDEEEDEEEACQDISNVREALRTLGDAGYDIHAMQKPNPLPPQIRLTEIPLSMDLLYAGR